MKKPIDLLIYPAFVMAAVLVVNLSPLVMKGPHVPFEELDITNESKIIVARESSTTIAFNDFVPAQISTPTQTAIVPTNTAVPVPSDTATPLPAPGDTPTFTPVPTNTPPTVPRPTSTRALTFTPGPTSRATSSPAATATSTATVSWPTWTATVAGAATTTASPTARALPTLPRTPSPLLDRLADDKPSIWGNKGFYVLLGLVYLTLLGLFLGQVINTFKGRS